MVYRKLGSTDFQVPVVIFGAWAIGGWWWGGRDDENAVSAIRKGIDLGINCIDTAPMYGFGHSEQLVGRAIKGKRNEVIIATKCGLRWDLEDGEWFFNATDDAGKPARVYRNLRYKSILEECDRSLKNLGTDYIDLYQCHWPDPATDLDETMDAMLHLQRKGKIRAIGVSNFTADAMEMCLRKVALASDQPKYSLLSREAEQEVLPFCLSRNVSVLAYSPLEQGLLTGKFTVDHEFSPADGRRTEPWFKRENRQRALRAIGKMRPVAQNLRVTLGQLAINWIISQPGVTSAIVGARNPQQVQENAGGANFTLTKNQLEFIRSEFEAIGKPS